MYNYALRMPDKLQQKLNQERVNENRSLNAQIVHVLEQWFKVKESYRRKR